MHAIGIAIPQLCQPLYDGGLDEACGMVSKRREHRPSKPRDLIASIIAS